MKNQMVNLLFIFIIIIALSILGSKVSLATSLENTFHRNMSSCEDDLFEENDSLASAKVLSVPSTYDDLMSCAGNDDYFEFVVPANSAMKVELFLDYGHEVRFRLYDSNGDSIKWEDTFFVHSLPFVIENRLNTPEKYFINVQVRHV